MPLQRETVTCLFYCQRLHEMQLRPQSDIDMSVKDHKVYSNRVFLLLLYSEAGFKYS